MNANDTIDTTTRNLRCQITDRQLMEEGKLLSEAGLNVRQLEEDKKRVMSDYTAKIKTEKAKMPPIEAKIRTGYEFRDVECTIEWSKPRKAWKTLTRIDTGERFEEEMTPAECQTLMNFMNENQKSDKVTAKKKKEGLVNIDIPEATIPEEVKALKRKGRK